MMSWNKWMMFGAAALVAASCGNEPEPKTNNGTTTGTNNGTSATNNGTGGTNNGTSGTTGTNNGTTATNNGAGTCTFDADCATGEACEGTQCVPTCVSDDDCLAGEICAEGINTAEFVCMTDSLACTFDADCADGEACEGAECVPTCEFDEDCAANEICAIGFNTELTVCQPDPDTPVRYAVMLETTTVGDGCTGFDPGPDIFGVGLEADDGTVLGWAEIMWDEIQLEDNDHTDTSLLDGTAPDLGVDFCPDMFDGNVVSIGCGEAFMVLRFIDSSGNPVAMYNDGSMAIRVYEWGGQCSTGSVDDTYSLYVCSDVEAFSGEVGTCDAAILIDAAGESIGTVSW